MLNPKFVKIAELLHKALCRHNHTDGCGWYYFDWVEPLGCEKKSYYKKAERICKLCEGSDEQKLIEIIEEIGGR
jgi:hypothetical protein